jgi:hypothetical protein
MMLMVTERSSIYCEIKLAEAAALIDKSIQTIGVLVRGGYISPPGRGRYVIHDVVAGHQRWLDDSAKAQSVATHRGAVAAARARLLELKVSEQEGRLVDLNEALGFVEKWATATMACFVALPSRATQDLVERQRLTVICDGFRTELVAQMEARMAELSKIGGNRAGGNRGAV